MAVTPVRQPLAAVVVPAALILLSLSASALRADVVITEIHYAPTDPDNPSVPRNDLEFVEIFNDIPEAYDVSGFVFTRGISLKIPEGTFIPGRGYLVVCKDAAAVRSAYGISNTVGDFRGVLDNAGETVELANPQGRPVSVVSYNDRGQWPSGAKGTGHSLSIRYEYLDPSDADSWTLSSQMGGTPGRSNFNSTVTFEDRVLLASDEVWRYFKGTQNPPSAWREIGFDDGSWASGATGIGYGDGDDRTDLGDMRNGYLTVFCRKTFTVEDLDSIDTLVFRVIYDDGFYAYLNTTEIGSRNVTGRDFDDPAGTAGEPETVDITVPKNLLADGDNVLAVQVHNANLSSSDLSFIPELLSRRVIQPEGPEISVVINEGHFRTDGTRFVELYNTGDSAVSIAGYHLTDDFGDLTRYSVPADRTLPARGFLVFTEEELGFDLSIVDGVKDRIPIALTNPSGTRVVDGRVFAPAVDEKSEARMPDGDEKFAAAAEPTPGAANEVQVAKDVIFNEIMYHPISGRDDEEFIEFYNRGSVARDVGEWTVEGVDYQFPPGIVILPGEYLVIAKSPARIRNIYGLGSNVVVEKGYEGRLGNRGERLRLVDLAGNVADQVRYRDGGDWSIWADGHGSSLERIDPFGESSEATTWDASDDSHKATTQTFSYIATHGGGESDFGVMLMTEGIAIVDDLKLERVSGSSNLIPNADFEGAIRTPPWRIEGTHIRSGRTADPAERINGNWSLKLICWGGGGDYKVNRVEVDTGTQSGSHRITYNARWIVGSRTILTIGYYNASNPSSAGLAGANRFNVPRDLGTPAAMNSVTRRQIDRFGDANQGPAIDRVSHQPGVPEGGESVTVTARVRDPDGVSRVRLFHRTQSPSGNFSVRDMSETADEGIFQANLPGQSSGIRVLFYIEATDGSGRVERYPRDLFERTHPPVVDPDNPNPNDALYCMYRHDVRFPSTDFHSYRFVLNQDNQDELGRRRVLSNAALDGTFVFGGTDVYYNAKIRFAGSPWLRPSGGTFEKSYTIKMPKDDILHGRKRAFNLDEHARDGRERIAHYLLRQNAGGTPLPYFDTHALVRFQLNDVRTGTYEALDRPNRQYVDFWFPDEQNGPHYEMDDRFSFNDSGGRTDSREGKVLAPPYGNTTGGSNKENYRWYFALRNRKGDDDFNPLIGLCQLMDPRVTPTSTFDSNVFRLVDVEEVLRVWAIRLNIDDWDTWCGNRGKNAYFYQSVTDGLWRLIPWDLELTFGNTGAFSMPSSPNSTYSNHFTEITRMINRPYIKRLYYGILKEQTDNFFFTGGSSPLSAYASQLSGSGVDLRNTLSYVNTRGGMIRSWIRSVVHPQVTLRILTNNGEDMELEEEYVDLDGEAPVEVFTIAALRNGEMLDDPAPVVQFSTTNMTGWSVRIRLRSGENDIELLGFNSRGELVDSDSIVVTTGPFPERFVRADANLDGIVDISDAIATLRYLFDGALSTCLDALDANDSGDINITDAVVTLSFLFKGGASPEAPFPTKGTDPTDVDPLDCGRGL